ncbi:hypothetical protein LSAT2_006879 [Lamellibrachia satsuma]|nr:hypothetical protein LSAT2_006879 [Lamellibrachia satsuma]
MWNVRRIFLNLCLPLVATTDNSTTCEYVAYVKTSDVEGASTDNYIKLQLFNKSTASAWIELDNKEKNDFEQGRTDLFVFGATCFDHPCLKLSELGFLNSLTQCLGDQWHCEEVKLSLVSGGFRPWQRQYTFREWIHCGTKEKC